MNIVLKNELDPLFEVVSLLYMCNREEWREGTVKQLCNYGVRGEEFVSTHYKIIEKYLKVFEKYKVSMPQEEQFFKESDDDMFLLTVVMAIENRRYLNCPSDVDNMELRSLLAYCLIDNGDRAQLPDKKDMPYLPDETAMVEFLDAVEVRDEDKWYILNLMREPGRWLAELFEVIQANLPAYERAAAAVEKPLGRLLEKLERYDDSEFLKLADACGNGPEIYAALAMPLIQIVSYTRSYRGLLLEELEKCEASADTSKEVLTRKMKALADKSKLDILCELKKSSKYNLELSEVTGLSPSTTSHHMTGLLNCGFVTVEKREGRVYYCLQKEEIEKFLGDLKDMIL